MAQTVIALSIVSMAILYVVISIYKSLISARKKSGCVGCSGCELSAYKKNCCS